MKLRYILSIFLCVSFSLVSCGPSRAQASSLKNQLNSYCQKYVSALADLYLVSNLADVYGGVLNDVGAQVDSVQSTGFFETVFGSFGNLFQPPGSKFHSGYTCKFHLSFKKAKVPGSLKLYLVKNKEFAEYTKWDNAQIIDIGEVTQSGQTYYVVVKYIKVDGKSVKFSFLK